MNLKEFFNTDDHLNLDDIKDAYKITKVLEQVLLVERRNALRSLNPSEIIELDIQQGIKLKFRCLQVRIGLYRLKLTE